MHFFLSIPSLGHAFLVYLTIVIAGVIAILIRYLPRRSAIMIVAGILAWLAYVYALGELGIPASNESFPPGLAILLLPVFGLVIAFGLSPAGRKVAYAVPLWMLVGFEVFRVGVELVLAELHGAGLTPDVMTVSAGNVEILFAATAPLAAIVSCKARRPEPWIVVWSVLGLLSLANVATRAVLSVPGWLNFIPTAVPDIGIIMPPFTFIPGVMAPLALLLHLLSIRSVMLSSQISARSRQ